jgi:hypothetical protein
MANSIIQEGGNVFKDAQGSALTQRIAQSDVLPTVRYLERITGLNLVDSMLGSTGQAVSSGDIDLAVDASKINKDTLITQLRASGVPVTDVKKSGDNVHLRAPIAGQADRGHVQVDFMFSDYPQWQKFIMGAQPSNSQYKGVHRTLLMASIAKALNMKLSYKNGLLDRATNDIITQDPDELARLLLGTGHDRRQLASVESIIKQIKERPDFEQLVSDAREAFARENMVLPESRPLPGTGAWFRYMSNITK